jgi:16S rRNA (cytidine1402-2'-O)-methyltransferase
MLGTLYIVATPIGNLDDFTIRAADILKSVDVIACEDTRHTVRLLNHLGIRKTLISYHQHSSGVKTDQLIKRLVQGESIALVSDAGTPGINDPGNLFVRQVIDRTKGEVKVVAIPGPCAMMAAASISGLPCDRFNFLGFLPHKKGRETMLKQIVESEATVIFYESTHRIMKALGWLRQNLEPQRLMTVARELTKQHEERVGETAEQCYQHFINHPTAIRGEFVVIVGGRTTKSPKRLE